MDIALYQVKLHVLCTLVTVFLFIGQVKGQDPTEQDLKNYICPAAEFCSCLYYAGLKRVGIHCQLPSLSDIIMKDVAILKTIQPKWTALLYIICTTNDKGYIRDKDIGHLNELTHLFVEGCHFDLNEGALAGLPLTHVDFTSTTLIEMPENSFTVVKDTLVSLIIKGTKLPGDTLPNAMLCSLTNLVKLDLEGCSIPDLFAGMHCKNSQNAHFPALELLHLKGNSYQKINTRFVNMASKVKSIDLKDCGLQSVSEDAFQGLDSIEEILLDHNPAVGTVLPTGLFHNLFSLQKLGLGNVSLVFPDQFLFRDLQALISLNIADNNLKVSDLFSNGTSVLGFLSNLTTLNVNGNNLDNLPSDTFDGLIGLRALYASENGIHQLPDDLFQHVINIETINVAKNKLTEINNKVLQNLNSLTGFYAYDNELSKIAVDAFETNGKLNTVNLQNNMLSSFPKALSSVSSLILLFIDDNDIKELKADDFASLQLLQFFSIKNNSLTELQKNLFMFCPSLIIALFDDNKIVSISPQAFTSQHIAQLHLRRNEIQDVEGMFTAMQNLNGVALTGNKIQHVKANSFPSRIQIINLHDNLISKVYPFAFKGMENLGE